MRAVSAGGAPTIEAEPARTAASAQKIRVFLSYDREHDGDLHDLLVEQSAKATSGFEICARSRPRPMETVSDAGLRRDIRHADAMIAICGEHTDDSERVGTELRIAREEKRPYFLLWGRRDLMCTKPKTAKSVDGMYSWTWEILQNQILTIRRAAGSNERLAELSRTRVTATSRAPRPR